MSTGIRLCTHEKICAERMKTLFKSMDEVKREIKELRTDINKGKEKSVTCVACHGENGISVSPIWPNLAGQHLQYLKSQMLEFRKGQNGKRNNPVMYGITLALSDDDIESLAMYYSSLDKSNEQS